MRKFIFLQTFHGELHRDLGEQNFVLCKISMISRKSIFWTKVSIAGEISCTVFCDDMCAKL